MYVYMSIGGLVNSHWKFQRNKQSILSKFQNKLKEGAVPSVTGDARQENGSLHSVIYR